MQRSNAPNNTILARVKMKLQLGSYKLILLLHICSLINRKSLLNPIHDNESTLDPSVTLTQNVCF